MKCKVVLIAAVWLCTMSTSYAQCLSGSCEVGLSRSEIDNGVFIGHYENGEKMGLGISYIYNPTGTTTSFSDYFDGNKTGVEYQIDVETGTENTVHTFKHHLNGAVLYPAIRISKVDKKTKIEVAFSDDNEWSKYDGDTTYNGMSVMSVIHDGSPAFIGLNGDNQVMAVSATIASVNLLTSLETEKYYNPIQLDSKDDRIVISHFPKAGADETVFRTTVGWDMKNFEEGLWLYKRYFNDELSYKFTYEDVLELPSQKDIKQQKLQKAFDFIAAQVDEYDFEKGYEGKAKDFIDMLKDIKERAELKGLDISHTYDLTMIKLHLQSGNEDDVLKYSLTACIKSPNSYTAINEMITNQYPKYIELLPLIKENDRIAVNND